MIRLPMPEITIRGVRHHYVEEGHGAETIVFAHGFLLDHTMFTHQIEAFRSHYRCLAWDWRGQGRSAASCAGYHIDDLTADAEAFLAQTHAAPCHWVGVSLGGFVGLRLGARRPELIQSLVLGHTSAQAETPAKRRAWTMLEWFFLLFGARPIAAKLATILLGSRILADPARAHQVAALRRHLTTLRRLPTFHTARAIVKRTSVADELAAIQAPTLILTGTEDHARTRAEADFMQQGIPNARLAIINGAGHSSSIEEPVAFQTALQHFWEHPHPPQSTAIPHTYTTR